MANNYNNNYNINNNEFIVTDFIQFMNNQIRRMEMRDYILAEIDYKLWITRSNNAVYAPNYDDYMDNNIQHYRNLIFNNFTMNSMENFLNQIHNFSRDELKNIYNRISGLYRQ